MPGKHPSCFQTQSPLSQSNPLPLRLKYNPLLNLNVNSLQNINPSNKPNNTNKTLRSVDKMIKNPQDLYHHLLEIISLGLVV